MLDTLLANANTIAIALGLVLWILQQLRNGHIDSVRAILKSLVQEVVHVEGFNLEDPDIREKVKASATKSATTWLVERKVSGTMAQNLVNEAVAVAVTELARMLSQNVAIAKGLEKQSANNAAANDAANDAAKQSSGTSKEPPATEGSP